MKKWIFIILGLALIGGAIYGYYEFTRKPTNAGDRSTDFTLTAEELMNEFATDEKSAQEKYHQKTIEVSGTVSEVTMNENNFDVLLETSDLLTGVNVQLIPEEGEKAEKLQPGQKVTLKGICSGKLADIELNNGVILKQ